MEQRPVGKILIVDDEAELRFILRAHFEAAGFETFEAASGLEAIRIALEQLPDVILMDVGLPEMDGVETTQRLKDDARTRAIPVIMLTGQTTSDAVVRGLQAGAHEYVRKPFNTVELLARVQTVHGLAIAQRNLDQLNAQLENQIDEKTARLQLLNEYMRNLNVANAVDQVLDLIVQYVQRTTGARRLSLFLVDSLGESLLCKRTIGIEPDIVEAMKVTPLQGITGRVFHTAKTLAARAFGHPDDPADEYSRTAFVSTPLRSTSSGTRDGTLGVLNVTEKADDNPFSDEEIECIRSIADAGAIALANMMRRDQLQQSISVLLRTVGQLAEYRDEETTEHLERVTRMARILSCEVSKRGTYAAVVTAAFIERIVQAAPMHDIGKVGIPDEILTKPGKLTTREFDVMKTHTEIGRQVLSQALDPTDAAPLLRMCIDIAHCHHERYDGAGYPNGLRETDIPLAARIIALVDAYDAITSRRRYKEPQSHDQAVAIIREDAGHHFDPVLVEAFVRCQSEFDEVRARHDEAVETAAALST